MYYTTLISIPKYEIKMPSYLRDINLRIMLFSGKYIIITSIIEDLFETHVKNNSLFSHLGFFDGFQQHLDIYNVRVHQVSLFPCAAK